MALIGGNISGIGVCAPKAEVDKSQLSAVLSELDSRIVMAGALADRLHKAMDYVTGPIPEDVANGTDCRPNFTSSGAIAQAQDKLTALYRLLNQIDDGVRRLERVVG